MAKVPLGYESNNHLDSLDQVYDQRVVDKAVSIAKSAIQGYINNCLHPNGEFRSFIKASVSPEGLQYVTELSYDDEMKVHPNLRKTHLSKWFAENTGRLPSILIIDQGLEHVDTGLNELIEGKFVGGKWQGKVAFVSRITLSVTVATYSEEETNTLATMLFYMFTSLVHVIHNGIIREPGRFWEVRIPMEGVSSGQISNFAVEGDSKNQVWARSIDMQLDFETIVGFETPFPEILFDVKPEVANLSGEPSPRILNLTPNQKISLGVQYPLYVENIRNFHYLGISDPRIAVITREPPYIIQPIRQGKALLQVRSSRALGEVVLDIPFKVTI